MCIISLVIRLILKICPKCRANFYLQLNTRISAARGPSRTYVRQQCSCDVRRVRVADMNVCESDMKEK